MRASFLQGDEGVAPGGIVRRLAGAGDRDQAAARREARQRGGDMAQGGVGDAALDMRRAEKGGFISTTLGRDAARRDDRGCARRRAA